MKRIFRRLFRIDTQPETAGAIILLNRGQLRFRGNGHSHTLSCDLLDDPNFDIQVYVSDRPTWDDGTKIDADKYKEILLTVERLLQEQGSKAIWIGVDSAPVKL